MRHCGSFSAAEIYYLADTDLYTNRVFSIGFCPICKRPVAELAELSFTGGFNKISVSGIHAQRLMQEVQNDIVYSASEVNYRKIKSKPYGWKYGLNKAGKNEKIRQYACDFYGNKELIKQIVK